MSKYIDKNLGRNERIVLKAKISLLGGLSSLVTELAVTNKNVIGKYGLIRKHTMTSPLNKVQNVSLKKGIIGSIFRYAKIRIDTASGTYNFPFVKKAEEFKKAVLDQIDVYEQERVKQQAAEMAQAMSSVINK